MELAPPTTLLGVTVTDEIIGRSEAGITVMAELKAPPAAVADTITVLIVETAGVTTLKVPVLCPAGIVTLAGIWMLALSDERVIGTPVAGAKPVSTTVAIVVPPPTIVAGLMDKVLRTAAETETDTVWLTPLAVTVIFAVWVVDTAAVDIAIVALDEPAGTVTVAGTWTAELSLDTLNENPPGGAMPVKPTVPVIELPALTEG